MAQSLHICMFNTDIPVPNVVTQRAPTYGKIFHDLLVAAAKRISTDLTIRSTEFDTRKGEYPASLEGVDMILITGSIHSTYEDIEWIHRLEEYVIETYRDYPGVKWFGSCFGHQLICQALLKQYGVRVDAHEKGLELGVQEVAMDSRFRKDFDRCPMASNVAKPVKKNLRMQFIHGDHVVIPSAEALPASWSILGSTAWCGVQGVYEPGRVLCYQGHFEFDRFINSETIKTFFAKRSPEWMDEALSSVEKDDDAEEAADMVVWFMLQKSPAESSLAHSKVGGLLTPPEQAD